jgi:hypothetical protein
MRHELLDLLCLTLGRIQIEVTSDPRRSYAPGRIPSGGNPGRYALTRMPTKSPRGRRRAGLSISEAISAVGWQRLLLWSAAASVPVAVAANTLWLIIQTLLPPSMARGAEFLPYLGGVFLATVVGQVLGPYAALRWELERLDPGYKVWFGVKNPLTELNSILWNMGTEAQANSFRNTVLGQTEELTGGGLDEGRTILLTAVSRNLESVPKLFHVSGTTRKDVAEFGPEPPYENLVSLARGLRQSGWGQVQLKPGWDWLVYTPSGIVGSLVLLVAMVVILARMPSTGLVSALAAQCPFYLVVVAFFMLPSAGRPSGIVQSALPKGLGASNLDESLALARDPFERMRLYLGALPPDDQKALLEATHFALWKTVRAWRARSRVRAPRP